MAAQGQRWYGACYVLQSGKTVQVKRAFKAVVVQ